MTKPFTALDELRRPEAVLRNVLLLDGPPTLFELDCLDRLLATARAGLADRGYKYKPEPLRLAFIRGLRSGIAANGERYSREEQEDLARAAYPDTPVTEPKLVRSDASRGVHPAGTAKAREVAPPAGTPPETLALLRAISEARGLLGNAHQFDADPYGACEEADEILRVAEQRHYGLLSPAKNTDARDEYGLQWRVVVNDGCPTLQLSNGKPDEWDHVLHMPGNRMATLIELLRGASEARERPQDVQSGVHTPAPTEEGQ